MNTLLSRVTLACAAAAGLCSTALAAEVPLYDTGPSEDSSFLRFVNATPAPVDVVAAGSNAKTSLTGEKPATSYFPIKAKAGIKGSLQTGSTQAPVDVSVEPGEFATVFAVASGTNGLASRVVREQPDDFNATKVSLAFYSMDPGCASTSLQVAGRTTALFENVPVGELKRRLINPVTLSVQLLCAGKPVGDALPLGALQAGQRYSIFAVPGSNTTRMFIASDALAN